MSKLYDKLLVSQDIRNLFNNGRKKLNSALDSKSLLEYNNHIYTRREIIINSIKIGYTFLTILGGRSG